MDLKDFIYKKTNCHFIDYGSEKKENSYCWVGTGQQILNYSGINDADMQ